MAQTSLAGILFFSANGQTYQVVGDAKYSVGSVKRETLGGADHIHGFGETPTAPYISLTLRDSGGLSVASFNAMTNVDLQLQLRNGKLITGSGMWTVEVQEVDTTEAKLEVRFEGTDGSVTEN
jgi:hypothetical protein